MNRIFPRIAGLWVLTSVCCTPDTEPLEFSAEWLNLGVGHYWTYEVRDVAYELGDSTVLNYDLTLEVTDSVRNDDGSTTYVLTRTRSDLPEEPPTTWSIRISKKEAIRQEGSIPYLIFRFPVRDGLRWNGNTYNTTLNPGTNLPEDEYEIMAYGSPVSGAGETFDFGLQVLQEDNQEFIIFYDNRRESYALQVGWVEARYTQLKYCTDESCLGQQQIESGRRYLQLLSNYGKR